MFAACDVYGIKALWEDILGIKEIMFEHWCDVKISTQSGNGYLNRGADIQDFYVFGKLLITL